jgi:hypothetical protein
MATKSYGPGARPVTRETNAYFRDRGLLPIVVTVNGPLLEMRLKGRRTREVADIASVYGQALKQRVAAEQAEKRKRRATRRKP